MRIYEFHPNLIGTRVTLDGGETKNNRGVILGRRDDPMERGKELEDCELWVDWDIDGHLWVDATDGVLEVEKTPWQSPLTEITINGQRYKLVPIHE